MTLADETTTATTPTTPAESGLSDMLSSFKAKSRESQVEAEQWEKRKAELMEIIDDFSDDEQEYLKKESELNERAYEDVSTDQYLLL